MSAEPIARALGKRKAAEPVPLMARPNVREDIARVRIPLQRGRAAYVLRAIVRDGVCVAVYVATRSRGHREQARAYRTAGGPRRAGI